MTGYTCPLGEHLKYSGFSVDYNHLLTSCDVIARPPEILERLKIILTDM
jgi:hypothetical protein